MKKYIIILITSLIISISLISLTIIDNYNKPKVTPIDDSYLAYFVDGQETNTIPEKGNYDVSITCDKGATGTWDYNNWAITIYNATQTGTRCSVSFTTRKDPYLDGSGASAPELYAGLIPIKYDTSNNIVVADYTTEWYNYNNHEWANAILIDQSNPDIKNKYINSDGSFKASTIIDENDILQMYVWVPRYKYKLFNAEGNTGTTAQMIEVEFESKDTAKSTGSTNGEWLTHPAFTFGTTELNGIWVGKFESSGSTIDVTIIPNVSSLGSKGGTTVGAIFNASRAIESNSKYGLSSSEVDTHMMKNMEWGAVAYLTNSKYGRYETSGSCISSGCEVWKNPNSNYTTGCAGSSVDASSTSSCNQWNTSTGVNASTTGNIYGIYDMSGGAWEYLMGNYNKTADSMFGSSEVDFNSIESKYYDLYTGEDVSYGMLGDSTKETQGWNNDSARFVVSSSPWFNRGGDCTSGGGAGVFHFSRNIGRGGGGTLRVVLSSE